jgi:capsular polysaccharide transport system permease protein
MPEPEVEARTVAPPPPVARPGGEIVPMREALPAVPREALRFVRMPLPGRRRGPLLWTFALIVVLPTLVASVYLCFIASNRYVAEFRAAVRSVEPMKSSEIPSLLGLAGMSQTGNDSHAVVQYLESRQALEDIDAAASVRTRYEAPTVDWLSRLGKDEPVEGFVRYWRRMLDAYYETTTGTIVVRVEAFAPADALAVSSAALSLSEKLVNQLSTRARADTLSFADAEVAKAEARLSGVNLRLRDLRDKEQVLDPRKAAETTLGIAAKLREEIAGANAQLSAQRSSLSASAPSVIAMRERIVGLERELDRINGEATAAPGSSSDASGAASPSKPLSGVISDFDQLENERLFAEKAYQSALASLETARMDANRQQIYLATIVRPELPQEPVFPRPIRNTATVFGIALAIWLIGALAAFAIRDHM